jgi:hypothetical protein
MMSGLFFPALASRLICNRRETRTDSGVSEEVAPVGVSEDSSIFSSNNLF